MYKPQKSLQMKNLVSKLFLVFGLLILLFIVIFLYRRDSIKGIILNSEKFAIKNNHYIDSLHIFYSNNLQRYNCDKINLNFNWKIKYLDIGCLDSNYRLISSIGTPKFIKEFFLENDGNSIMFSEDGILFYTLYHSYGLKKFSLKYFFNEHKLNINDAYLKKYKVVDKYELGNNGYTCTVINKHWLLISMDEKK